MPQEEFITTDIELYNYIRNFIEAYDPKSIRTRLKNFKIHIYCGSLGHRNPAFYYKLQKELNLSNELKYVHELMYLYLINNNYLRLSYHYSNSNIPLSDDFSLDAATKANYEWNIPNAFAPFLTAYILSAFDTKEKNVTTRIFFDKMDKHFENIIFNQEEPLTLSKHKDIMCTYNLWKKNFLGQAYFETLESIYDDFANNPIQIQTLSDATIGLTYALLESSAPDDLAFSSFTSILIRYRKQLEEVITNDKNKLYLLYPYTEPVIVDFQKSFIKESCESTNQAIEAAYSYIISNMRTHHKQGSRYELAIDNFDSFSKDMDLYKNNIMECATEAPFVLRSKIDNYLKEPGHSQAISQGTLIIDSKKIEELFTVFEKTIKHYSDDVIRSLDKLTKTTKFSSGDNPEDHNSVTVDHSFIESFNDDLNKQQKNFKSNCEKLIIPFLLLRRPGYLNEHKYPVGIITPSAPLHL